MADDKIALSIEIEADRAQMSLGELEEGFDGLREKLKATNRGTEEGRKQFKELSTQMAQTSKEIKNIELGFEGLDREQVASELGSVSGAIGDVTASLILMGGESETLEQIGASIEKAMAISMGFKGAIEGLSSASKLYNNLVKQGKVAVIAKAIAEKAAAAATWIMTAAQTAFNVVMSMNPIALVVIAITALVAGFILLGKNIKKVIDFALLPMTLTIELVKAALRSLGLMEESTAKQTKKAEEEKAQAAVESAEKRVKANEELIKSHKELTDKTVSFMDFEIRKRKAAGVNTIKWERVKLKTLIELAKKEAKLQEQRLIDLDNEFKARLRAGKVGPATAFKLLKAKTEASKAIIKANEEQLESEQDLEISTIESQKKIDDAAKKSSADRKAQREKDAEAARLKLIEDGKALAEFEEEQARIRIQLIQDEGERKRAEIEYNSQLELEALEKKGTRTFEAEMLIAQKKHQALAELKKSEDDKILAAEKEAQDKRDAAKLAQIEFDKEIALKQAEAEKLLRDTKLENDANEEEIRRLAVEDEFQNKLATLEEQGLLTTELEIELTYSREQALADIQDEFRQKEEDAKKAQRDKDFALATAAIGALTALNDAALATDLLNAAGNDAKQEKIRKASFERQKKLNIAMAAINGAQAVIAGFAQGGLPMAILAGVTAAAQLAAIVATTYQSSASPTEVDETVPTPDGAGGGGGGAQINAVTNTSTILGNQQVFVTETDITDTQNNVSVIEESATF